MYIDYCLNYHYSDCEDIQLAINKHGFNISIVDAAIFWAAYSDYYAASWLILPCEDEIYMEFLNCKEDIRKVSKAFLANTEFFDSDLVVGI